MSLKDKMNLCLLILSVVDILTLLNLIIEPSLQQ